MGHMDVDAEQKSSGRSFGKTALAALIFIIAAYLLFGLIIHILSFLFSTVLFVVAVIAVIWALRVLL
jgi:hypothetical protein